ncbi:hypothetical protein LOY35_20665 [Pseudomonas sp. B21-028]|uniref:hypothetical protein n=1 Tax=Pseudomonas sp. B21-028 TaxID=2895480 RepID=UPI00215E72EA|nr:hypothetical protein [Pseudomonas sp. B21-028]UVL82599.1 hypothetical protein LOY35_20665 [Pseudomonas sp. B21-028]
MEEGNAIALIWNGITESGSSYTPDLPLHPLSKNEAEGSVPIEIVVAGEHLTAIEGGTLDLYYKLLRDAVSREVIEEESLHADLLTIGVPQAELPAPVVEGESDGVLDPADKPNGTRLIVRQYSGQKAGDRVHILWWGSNTGRYRDSLPVTEVTENQDIPFTISAALIEGNRNGTVRAMYWVRRVAGGTSPSEILLMSIGAGMDLTAPSVKQATGSSPSQQLNPVAAKDALTVVIPDYGVQPGDQVSVTWAGTAGAGSHTTPVQALPADREIAIPVEVIAYNLGRSVTVTYTVTRNGNESDPSAALNLAVQTLAENDLSGSKPKILQAANNGEGTELDLNSISADATCRAGIWPLIAPDQDVWLRLKGTRADGTVPYDLNIWAPPPRGPRTSPTWITQGFYDVMAAYSYLKELKDGSTLSMEFKADFSKTTNEANALTFPLRTYTVKTVALVNPTLTDVRDTKGSVVGKTTVETTVTVTGTGSSGQQIQLMNGAANIGSPFTIPATGTIWSTSLTGLTPNAYSIKAKALYGTGIPDSAAKNFNVTAIEIPRITNVETAAGVEVPDGSITDQVNVTLFGKASKNQRVEIFDSAISKGTVDVNGGGDWSLHQNGLEQGLHSFTAKGLYGSNPESAVRSFTVQTSTEAPTITSVQDPANTEIPNGGYTVSTTVNVIGRAQRSERLQIFDNAVYRGDVEVDGNGNWSLLMGALVPGPHLFTAKALYGNNPESNVWGINVYVPLIVDPSDINLSATHYRKDATPPNPPSGAYAHRAVSGGTPPYACTSSNPAAVEAYMYDASTVRVISKGSAGSTITVSDQLGQTTAFNVWASNVQMFLPAFNRGNYRNCRDWINGQGCRVPSEYEWGALWTNYNQNMGLGDWRNWILDPGGAPVGKKYVINPHTLAKFLIMDFGDVPPYASENADGFGVKGV